MACGSPIRNPPIVILPLVPAVHPATLIFVHGYNFSASQFNRRPPTDLSVAYHLHQSPALQHLKIVIAEALPNRHESMKKNVWYNIATPWPLPGNPEKSWEIVEYGQKGRDEEDMHVTMDYFESLVKLEVESGTPAKRIVFMGDSQGATIVAIFILTRRLAADLGAVISYAGFPPTPMQSISRMQRENGLEGSWSKQTTLFLLHGRDDLFVPVEVAYEWLSRLENFKDHGQGIAKIESRIVDGMKHGLTVELWPHVREFLGRVVPQAGGRYQQKL